MELAIILLVVGFAFVVAEVFFVSMGLFSVIAGACIVSADVIAFRHGTPIGWTFIAIEVIGIPLLVWGSFRVLPHLPFGRRMLLSGPRMAPTGGFPSLDHLVGATGVALTDLRPSGMAEIAGERVSVVGTGPMVLEGARLRVISVQGTEVKVRAEPALDSDT